MLMWRRIEGVMGLYDGYGTDPDYCSSAAMAMNWLPGYLTGGWQGGIHLGCGYRAGVLPV